MVYSFRSLYLERNSLDFSSASGTRQGGGGGEAMVQSTEQEEVISTTVFWLPVWPTHTAACELGVCS